MDLSNIFSGTTLTQTFVIILLAANAFFLARHFTSSDKLAETIQALRIAVTSLATELKTLQESDKEKSRVIQKLMNRIIKLQESFIKLRADFDNCKNVKQCETEITQ